MATRVCHIIHFYFILSFLANGTLCWDTDDLELFDLVEEVNGNFYDLLGVTQSASSSEIRRAYRKKSLVLHPDKNEAPDAEDQFRKLVAVYEVLKDEEKKEKYNLVLQNGLPDWRQPVFYYRKARKMGLLELALVLSLVITVGQYFVMWAIFLERRLALEDFFESKKKKEKKGKKKVAALNERLEEDMQESLDRIPRPQLSKLWFITLPIWIVKWLINLPHTIRQSRERKRLEREMIIYMEEERKRLEALQKEEIEQRKQKRSGKNRPDPETIQERVVEVAPVVYGAVQPGNQSLDDDEGAMKQTSKTGAWTDEEYVLLSKAYIKFPGGTSKRWEKIADMVGRPVTEVTAKCKEMKGNMQMNLSSNVQGMIKQPKKNIEISDTIISKPESSEGDNNSDVKLRRRNKPSKDPERTINISKQTVSNASAANTESSVINNVNQSTDSKTEKAVLTVEEKEADKAWSQNQQVILEWALKQYPKGTDQRWEKISDQIPGKSKGDCIERCKFLAEKIKQKKQQQS